MSTLYQTAVLICCLQLVVDGVRRPNIVFIMADDLGYNDIGYNAREHESRVLTPFLDELAENGVRLENYYVQSTCSPTRTQLMSGRYQIHTGIQHKLRAMRKHGLPLDNKIIPEQLRHCGYDTHMVGKWHLGMFRREYTPMYRGFNSFFGMLAAGSDHYTHVKSGLFVDMHENNRPTDEYRGVYSTHLYTEKAIEAIQNRNKSKPFFLYLAHQAVHSPIQVPDQYLLPFVDIEDEVRRKYAGMVYALDESVRNVSEQLDKAGMLDDTIFIFSTDNGGSPRFGGNNWPLRGNKNQLTEGGVKAVGFVSGLPLKVSGVKRQNFMHISDWLPTILSASRCPLMKGTPRLDGFDQWEAILENVSSPRHELLHGLDPERRGKQKYVVHAFDTSIYAALRDGPWKIVTGKQQGITWTPPPESGIPVKTETRIRGPSLARLFHIDSDPYEQHELSSSHPDVVKRLLQKLVGYQKDSVTVWYPDMDRNALLTFRRTGFVVPYVGTTPNETLGDE